ncbi:MAG: cadherin domain-containing protein, partial [Planctomycetaceae bacterium]|nr:cadherin domain-containing protein [Planctomycetaceae bacterium]
SKVSAIDGNVTLVGTGGTAGTHDSRGIDLLHDSRVEVVNGQMVIQGTGMGDGNDPLNKGSLGVRLSQNSGGQLISQGTGGITIVGQGDGLYEGFLVGADSIVGGPDAAGPISILSDSIRIDTTDPGTPVIQSSGPLTIQAIDGVLSLGLGDGATGELNLTNHELSFLADGFAELSFGFSKQFAGVVDLNHPVLKDDVTIQAGTIDLDGLASPGNSVEFQLNGGVLTSPDGLASHSVSAASIIVDGVLAPGTANGQVLIDGDLTFSPSSKFTVELFGTFPGTGYDQLVVNGAVHLGGIPLVTQLNYSPNITDSFVLVDNLGSGPIVGTFEGLPEASSIDLNGTHFFLTYQGGDGNDIALEQNNPPSLELSKSSVTLAENVNTSQSILISEIQVIDDGWGTNVLSLAGDDSNLFEIVNSKLYLKAGTKLDFESESVFHVRVNIDDPEIGANPDASVAVIVEISDANDAPVATGFTTNVPGNAFQGTLLGTVTGQDEDQGQTLSYSITAGNDLGIFAIGGTSGAVTVANAAALSRNDGTTQRLTITVSDNGVPLRTGTSEVTITIEKAPVTLSVETVSTSISENGGTTITKVSRSGNPSLPLTVQLHVDDPTEANIPSSVTFASGQSTVTTTLGAVDDPFVDGSQLVNITVSAVGSNPAQTQITIEDDDTLRPGQDLLLFDEDSRTFKLGTNTGTGFAWFESDTLAMNPGVLESYIGDFDGDGDLDGAVRHQDTKAVRVLLNNGDGTLSTPVSRGTVGTAGEAGFLQVGDYDGDGADELLWMYRNGSYSGFIFLKRLTPAATSHYMINANPGYDAMVTGDFNGDGFDDLVGLYDNASGTQTNIIPFYSIASTNPSFPRRLRAIGTAPTQGRFGESVAIGGLSEFQAVDLNGDGRDDLIAKTTQGTTPGQILHATTTGDVAGDGTLFVGVHRFVSSNRAPDFEPLEYPRAILTGNFDDALGRDLAMVTSTGQFHVSRATTNSAFLNPVVLRNPAGSWGTGSTNDDLLVGDWNGDGFHDLLSLTNRATVFLSTSSSFGVALDFGPIIGGPLGMVGAISPA